MEVHFTPDVQAKLDRLASETGRAATRWRRVCAPKAPPVVPGVHDRIRFSPRSFG